MFRDGVHTGTETATFPWKWLFVSVMMFLLLAGFIYFAFFPRYTWFYVTNMGVWAVAAIAGVASFFAPCSFPLLITFLTIETGVNTKDAARQAMLRRALRFSLGVSLGMAGFMLVTGFILAVGGSHLVGAIDFHTPMGRFLRVLAGFLILVLGLAQLHELPLFAGLMNLATPLQRWQSQQSNPFISYIILGAAYPIVGFGCNGPIIAGMAGQALAVGGFTAAMVAFGIVTLLMVFLMFVLGITATVAQSRVITVRSYLPLIKCWSGVLMVFLGAAFMIHAIWQVWFIETIPFFLP